MDLEVDIGEALEVLLYEVFRVGLSDLLPSHFCFLLFFLFVIFEAIEEEYMCEKYKYCSVFERERDRDGRIELDGK